MPIPAIIIAGTHSGSGKTTVTLAVLAAMVRRGVRVQGFKVGPDFLDPGHHAAVTGRPSRNLDTWLLDAEALAETYRRGVRGADLAVIEGVMGLFDGRGALDEAGSTADLARLWDVPVVIVVDAAGLAKSIAPLVRGYATFDPRVRMVGVVANRVGGPRHYAEYLVPALRAASDVEALGSLARDETLSIPSRHLGLLTADEFRPGARFATALADAAEATLDLDRMMALACVPTLPVRLPGGLRQGEFLPPPRGRAGVRATAGGGSPSPRPSPEGGGRQKTPPPLQGGDAEHPEGADRVALARDPAFCFYYEDNLDRLVEAGTELVPFSPLEDATLPEGVELIYLGGGYPEAFAERLAANAPMRAAIARYHADGGTILAECGGLMACCRTLRDASGRDHPMWDLIPARVVMQSRFAALGYVTVATDLATPLGPPGTLVRGHEFHYSTLEPLEPLPFATHLLRPDRDPKPDGIQIGGLLAGYAHMHFGSNSEVAHSLLGRRP